MTLSRALLTSLVVALGAGCSLRTEACGGGGAPQLGAAVNPVSGAPSVAPTSIKIAFLGDSITAGLGLLTDQAYPAVIQNLFLADGYTQVETINAGLSGDTTASGLSRVSEVYEPDVRIVVIALGGNDALRGLAPQETHDNLAKIIDRTLAQNIAVVVVGMMAPPNLGPDYRESFSAAFVSLATEYRKKITYIPFLLEGVAGNPSLNQADGIHPTPEGAKVIADHLYQPLRIMVDAMQ